MKHLLYTCECGAIGIDDGTKEIKWASNLETLNRITALHITPKQLKNAVHSYMCDHCVNHWGLDLCQCGSGEPVGQCECECNEPSQVYGEHEKRALWVY